MTRLPRIVVAAPATGQGKTTVATGLMAALRRAGHVVSGHKVGPDYIDPGYHALACGRPGRNLDPHLVGEERIVPLLLHGARGADVAVVEGVMGLYDGRLGGAGFSSTAHVATLTRSPVVLVVDASRSSRSVGAVVHGMATFDPEVQVAGVVLNKVASPRHAREVADSVRLPVLGMVPRDQAVTAPSRHLGLVPAAERGELAADLDRLAGLIAEHVDLDAVLKVAGEAAPLEEEPWDPGAEVTAPSGLTERPVVALAGGRAFTFRYAETEELLRAAGCDVVGFDPLTSAALPAELPWCLPRWRLPRGARRCPQRQRRAARGPSTGRRERRAGGRRVRGPALPLPHRRRRPDGGGAACKRGDDRAADAALPVGNRARRHVAHPDG